MAATAPDPEPADKLQERAAPTVDLKAVYTNEFVKKANAKYPKG